MEALQILGTETDISEEVLIARVIDLHGSISRLETLKPCKEVNGLFTNLVKFCILPCSIDVSTLPPHLQAIRESLILFCGRAEGLLELEFSTMLGKIPKPLNNLTLFPYYDNYIKLAHLEYKILIDNGVVNPKKVAFVGSGPLPLTSIILAMQHMKNTYFDNYDIDSMANEVAGKIVASDGELEGRMKFWTRDIVEVGEELEGYDCVFLAALVGLKKEDKVKILSHLRKYMKQGGVLVVRSAKGGRAFLYPVVEVADMVGFDILSIFHPSDDVVNSVLLARKPILI
ncbi:nicotianamine synthase-like [Cucurbita maxima]|uniref:Nicotianamine synthase n=1 Tax=Cucurbita maxima TaxID=3661 RepID=A0A6J1JBQ8_CUCMA|nr:nicotianamine synthase-like [Cucurbita maxima]